MDYSYDVCMFEFTQEQADVMQAIQYAYRTPGSTETLEPIGLPYDETSPPLTLSRAETQTFQLPAVDAGTTVTCTTSCNNGDADLFVNWGAIPELDDSGAVDCSSTSEGSNEGCSVVSPADQPLFVRVEAWLAFEGLTVSCTIDGSILPPPPPPTCAQPGEPCQDDVDCCSTFNCSNGRPSTRRCI